MKPKSILSVSECDRWYDLGQPKLNREIARFGASAVTYLKYVALMVACY